MFQRLVNDRIFELGPENHGPTLGGADALERERPLRVTVFLRHDLVAAWFARAEAFADQARALLAALASPEHELARADAWIFVSVTQEVPGRAFQIGFKHRAYQALDAHFLA